MGVKQGQDVERACAFPRRAKCCSNEINRITSGEIGCGFRDAEYQSTSRYLHVRSVAVLVRFCDRKMQA